MATYKDSREMKLLGQNTSLSSILFRDGKQRLSPHFSILQLICNYPLEGVLYFLCVSAIQLVNGLADLALESS